MTCTSIAEKNILGRGESVGAPATADAHKHAGLALNFRSIAKAGLIAVVGRLSGIGSVLLLHLLLMRSLTISGYGTYSLAMAWAMLLTTMAMLGFDRAALRFPAMYLAENRPDLIRGFIARSHGIVTVSGGFAALTFLLITSRLPLFSEQASWTRAGLLLAIIPSLSLVLVQDTILAGLGVSWLGFCNNTLRAILVCGGVLSVSLCWGRVLPWHVLGFQCAAAIASYGLSASWIDRTLRQLPNTIPKRKYATRLWLGSSLPFMGVMVTSHLIAQSGLLALGFYSDDEASASFAAAMRIADLCPLPLHVANMALGPRFAAWTAPQLRRTVQHVVSVWSGIAFVGVALPTILLALYGDKVLGMILPGAESAYPALLVIGCGHLGTASVGPAAYFLLMTGGHLPCLMCFACGATISVVIAGLLTPFWGVCASGLATAAGLCVTHLLAAVIVRQRSGIDCTILGAARVALRRCGVVMPTLQLR